MLAVNWWVTMRAHYDFVMLFHKRVLSIPNAIPCMLDLKIPGALKTEISRYSPEFVVNAAALTSIEECEKLKADAHQVNAVLAGEVASVCKDLGLPFVHISTDHLTAGDNAFALEDFPLAPLNTYAKTKAEGEDRVVNAYRDALIVRTNFFGWGTSYRRSFSDFILDSLRNRTAITLFDDVFYTPIVIENLIRIIHGLLTQNLTGKFNVVGNDRVTKYDFGRRLAEAFGQDVALIRRGHFSDNIELCERPRDMSLSNHKVSELLGIDIGGIPKQIEMLRLQERSGIALKLKNLQPH